MSKRKINLQNILADKLGDENLSINDAIIEAMKEFGKQLLDLAAENAEIIEIPTMSYFIKVVNKQSILDTIKQVE